MVFKKLIFNESIENEWYLREIYVYNPATKCFSYYHEIVYMPHNRIIVIILTIGNIKYNKKNDGLSVLEAE